MNAPKSECPACDKSISSGYSRSFFGPIYCKKCVSSPAFQASLSHELRASLRKELGQKTIWKNVPGNWDTVKGLK